MLKRVFQVLLFLSLVLLPSLGYMWFIRSVYFAGFEIWATQHLLSLFLVILITKVIGILLPPVPGNLLTLASIPFFGWFGAYCIDLLGSVIGGSIAFFLGKKYGLPFIEKIFDHEMRERVEKIRVKKHREIESIFMMRLLGGGLISDAVSYAAGLLKIPYLHFLIGHISSHIVIGIPTYLIARNIFEGKNIGVSAVIALISFMLIYTLKGRYLE